MYLRTVKRKNRDGETVEYYQLAHNERHPVTRNSTTRIIHNFGRADQLDRDQLVRLCNSIARVCGLQVSDPLSSEPQDSQLDFPKGFQIIRTLDFGTVWVIEALWERLGIGKTLRDIGKSQGMNHAYERALLAMTANRLCEPKSKLGVWERWLSKVYMPGCHDLKRDHIYEAMDFFHKHAADIEKTIFFHTANLFNLKVDLIFYDTTTASFSIDQEDESTDESDEAIRKYGRSKSGVWTPQVIVALAVTTEGLPVRSWVFDGNTTDVNTIEKVRSDLRGWNLNRALFVADSGMNSQTNKEELSRACGKYLLATRMASVAEVKRDVLSKRGRYSKIKDNLQAKEVIIGDGERRRRYILCYNPKEAKRQEKHRLTVVERLEKEFEKHPRKQATAKWAIALLDSKRYSRYLTISKNNTVRIDRSKIRDAKRYDGKWVLETNDDTISMEDAACGYRGLMVIERCFRSLKRTQIKMCPMYHWLRRRIETHVKICVLALLIERVAELACGKPWDRICHALERLQITKFQTPDRSFFKRNEIQPDVNSILNKLDISAPKPILAVE